MKRTEIHKCQKGEMPEDLILHKFHERNGYLLSPPLIVGNCLADFEDKKISVTQRKSTNTEDKYIWCNYSPLYWQEI